MGVGQDRLKAMVNAGRVLAVIVVPEAVETAMPKAVVVTVVATRLRVVVVVGARIAVAVAVAVGAILHKGYSLDRRVA
jgi:prepilin signal peptidase PulO-like enzyme (type II secretory pathway)